jgi:hypothetical protein
MVREEDAAALVVDAAVALKLKGHDPVITAENSVWLMRYAGLMLAGFGIGTARETTEVTDGRMDCPDRGPAR